jgi:hypothetical protein
VSWKKDKLKIQFFDKKTINPFYWAIQMMCRLTLFLKKKQIEPSHIRKQIKRPSHVGPNKMSQTGYLGLLKK